MTYTAKTQRNILLFFLFLCITSMFNSMDNPSMYYFLIPYLLFILAAIFMNFKLITQEDTLVFVILLFNFTIYKKVVNHKQIKAMRFKRVGWARKCVIVKNKRGFNFRIINFYPEEIYSDLIEFADKYSIPITRTKDYKILERLAERRRETTKA